MTNIISGMPSFFWLTSSRLRKPLQDDVPYTTEALQQDLLRVQNAWDDCQAKRERDAIYSYLSAVFDLVVWWAAEDRAVSRGRSALKLQGVDAQNADEPFAAIILCTANSSLTCSAMQCDRNGCCEEIQDKNRQLAEASEHKSQFLHHLADGPLGRATRSLARATSP